MYLKDSHCPSLFRLRILKQVQENIKTKFYQVIYISYIIGEQSATASWVPKFLFIASTFKWISIRCSNISLKVDRNSFAEIQRHFLY